MNVGIIVYSHTGNTLSVAEKPAEALKAKGHAARVERVVPENDDPQARPARLKAAPDVAPYDALVFAAPVYVYNSFLSR